jgi:hypothetical protein
MRRRNLVDATAGKTARWPWIRGVSQDATAGETARRRRGFAGMIRRNADATRPRSGKTDRAA